MHGKPATIFYVLSSFVLAMAIFVLQPTKLAEVSVIRSEAIQSFSIAWQQTLGDQPYFDGLADIFDGTAEFYHQSALAMADILSDKRGTDPALATIFTQTYHQMAFGDLKQKLDLAMNEIRGVSAAYPDKFMQTPALSNIVPATMSEGSVSGVSIQAPVSPTPPSIPTVAPSMTNSPWFTATDGLTGQKYCVAVYNGEVNKYIGSCQNEYY